MERLSPYFLKQEFACRCGCGADGIDTGLVALLEEVRRTLGRPLLVTSGLRCPAHNLRCGGSPSSSHLTGLAADLSAPTPADKLALVREATRSGFERIGVGGDFIHLDMDRGKPAPALWTY